MTPGEAIDRFLHTGEHDPAFSAWDHYHGQPHQRGEAVLRRVLDRVLAHRVERAPVRPSEAPKNAEAQIRARIEPMVREYVAPEWAAVVLTHLPVRVRVITSSNFHRELPMVELHTAWRLANLLLDDLGMPPLCDDFPTLDGLCDGTRAWITPTAFGDRVAPFTDVIVHEAAHLLHNLTGASLGLPSLTPLVEVQPKQQETFAYASEVWAVLARLPSEQRGGELERFAHSGLPDDWRVDHRRLVRALQQAHSGEGWSAVRRTAVAE